jgi:hypothetical protein
MAMATQGQRILNAAVLALKRTTGIDARVHAADRDRGADSFIEVGTGRHKDGFGAEDKTVDRPRPGKALASFLTSPSSQMGHH